MCIMRLLDVGGTNLAQWRHKMPIYYGWRWHGMLTTERQQYSENPGGTPRQCISVCPWKLAQPIADYRRNTRLILNPQWHKKAACSFSYLFCCAGALCTILEFYFICITGIRNLNLNTTHSFNISIEFIKNLFQLFTLLRCLSQTLSKLSFLKLWALLSRVNLFQLCNEWKHFHKNKCNSFES